MRLTPSFLFLLAGLLTFQQVTLDVVALQDDQNTVDQKLPPWHNQKRNVALPRKREYDTHHYYAVEVSSSTTNPLDIGPVLAGAEYIEQVGELKNNHLFRYEKPLLESRDVGFQISNNFSKRADIPNQHDPILRRWDQIKQQRHHSGFSSRLNLSKRHSEAALSIKSVEKQVLRKRNKRDVIYDPLTMPHLYPVLRRDPRPGPHPKPYPRPPPIPDQKTASMIGEFAIQDPLFVDQWHIANDKRPGFDLNLTDIWKQDIVGKGITVALIDDGLDMHSPDLADNFYAAGSYDFNAHTALPEPREADDQHGTRCAGEIAAIKNQFCGVGVAHRAKVSGIRILSGPISDVDEAAALNYAYQENQIYSCSWGPPDDGKSMDGPKGLIAKAMLNGIQNGRDGKGSIFVFAGGNGGAFDDQCNFDGYTNSIYTMTIAAVDREGQHPYYSEMCSSILATGWSSGSGDHIHTTDVAWNGVNRCTSRHGGTSAAAPLVAGAVALALQVRPDLSWRDVQHIAVHSAVMVNPEDKDWQKTQAGRHYNHKYGYGVIDAFQFVEEAKRHKLVNPQAWYESPNVTVPATETLITQPGPLSSFTVTQDMLDQANLASLEHVTIKVWITHTRRGDVNVELTSPHGTRSVLARSRRYDDAKTGFPGWSFMSLKHWDESPIGEWKLRVFDDSHPDRTGNWWAWSLTLWGASIDPLKAVPWNFPEDSIEYHASLASAPSTTIVHLPSTSPPTGTTSAQHKKPTDHLPADHGTAPGENQIDFTNNQGLAKPEADTGYLSGLKKNSTWLIVASGVVLIFAASLTAFFVMRRKRASRGGWIRGGTGRRGGGLEGGSGGEYEFVPAEDDQLPLRAMETGSGRKSRAGESTRTHGEKESGTSPAAGGRRTKELYDAFAESSDEDDLYVDDAHDGSRRLLDDVGGQRPYRDDEDDEEEEQDHRFKIDDDETVDSTTVRTTKPSASSAVPPLDLLTEKNLEEDAESGTTASGSGSGSGSWQDAAVDISNITKEKE